MKHNIDRASERLTKKLIEFLESHPKRIELVSEPEWIVINRFHETWVEAIPNKLAPDFLEQLWDEAGDLLRIADENDSFYDHDKVETTGVETLAYYRTFRTIDKTKLVQDWGIHFNVGNFFAFVRRIAKSAGVPSKEALIPSYYFVLHHEMNHYEVDLGIFFLETLKNEYVYFSRSNPNELEEALGNGRGVTHPKVKRYRKYIEDRYANSSLAGYNKIRDYLSTKRQTDAFNQILISSFTSGSPHVLPLAHELMKPGEPFSSKHVPIYFHICSGNPNRQSSSMEAFTYAVNAITYSQSGERDLVKLTKRDSKLREKIDRAHRKILENPGANGNRLRKFQGTKDLIEARIDGGMRMLLRDKGEGKYEVIHVGTDIYDH